MIRNACNVNNPLYGEEGAVYVYGPQKGADENMLFLLEEGMLSSFWEQSWFSM